MAEQNNDLVDVLKGIYSDLGVADSGVKFEDFHSAFIKNQDLRKSVYADLKIPNLSFETFEDKLQVTGNAPRPERVKTPSDMFSGAKSQEEFIGKENAEKAREAVRAQKPKINFDQAANVMQKRQAEKLARATNESPRVATIRIKAEEAAKDEAYWKSADDVTLGQSLKNSASNMMEQLKQVVPQTQVFAADIYENILGKDLARDFYKWSDGTTPSQVRSEALDKLAEIKNNMLPTKTNGDVAGNLKHMNASGLVANMGDALTSIVSTAIPSMMTGGASIFTTMGGQSLVDYNEAMAEAKGTTVKKLYDSGDASFAAPILIGTVGAGLELVGLHSLEKLAKGKITGNVAKKLTLMSMEMTKEGMTEWLQTGLESANKSLGKGGDAAQATKAAWDSMTSKEGFNSFAMGVFASGGAAALGKMTNSIIRPKEREAANKAVSELSDLSNDLQSDSISGPVKDAIEEMVKGKVKEVSGIINDDIDHVDTLAPDQKKQADELSKQRDAISAVAEDQNVSETAKKIASDKLNEVNSKIDEVTVAPDLTEVTPEITSKSVEEKQTDVAPVKEEAKKMVDVKKLTDQELQDEIARLEQEDEEGIPSVARRGEDLSKLTDEELNSKLKLIKTRYSFDNSALHRGGPVEMQNIEHELNRREKDSVVKANDVNTASSNLDDIESRDRKLITPRDSKATREVLERYVGVKDLSDSDIQSDFNDAVLRSSKTLTSVKTPFALGAQLNQSAKEMISRGYSESSIRDMAFEELRKKNYSEKQATEKSKSILDTVFGNKDVTESGVVNSEEYINEDRFKKVSDVLDDAREVLSKDKESSRVIDFIEKTLGKDTAVKIDLDRKISQKNRGIYFSNEDVIGLNLDQMKSREEVYVIAIHELMHAATVKEIRENPRFSKELDVVLDHIRKELKLPSDEALIKNMISKGIIKLDSSYGTVNSKELLSEVFSNEKFRNLLDGIKVGKTNLLTKLIDIISGWISRSAKNFNDIKGRSSKESVAKYLMDLTEGVVEKRGKSEGDFPALSKNDSERLAQLREEFKERSQLQKIAQNENTQTKIDKVKESANTKLQDVKDKYEAREDVKSVVHKVKVQELTEKYTKHISEIKADNKHRAGVIKDMSDNFRDEIKETLKQASKDGILKGTTNVSTVASLVSRLVKADTPMKLLDASDFINKTLSDINYSNKVQSSTSMLARIKNLAKRQNLPANIASAMRRLSQIKPTDATNIDKLNEMLSGVIKSFRGENSKGLNTEEMRKTTEAVNKLTEKRMIDRYSQMLAQQGIPVPQNITLDGVREFLAKMAVDEKMAPDSIRDVHEAIYEGIKEDLNRIDESSLSPRKKEALDALKNIDVTKLDQKMVSELLLVTKNSIENGNFSGVVRIVNAHKMNQFLSNSKLNERARNATRVISKFGSKFRNNWATVTAQVDGITKDRYTLPHLTKVTGFDRQRDSFSVFKKRLDAEIVKPFNKIMEKHKKDLLDNHNQALLGMYADLNNFRTTWTEDQKQREFDGRLKAIRKSIDEMEAFGLRDKNYAKDNREYIKTLNKAYDTIKDMKSASEIEPLLNNGSKALYKEGRKFFEANKEQLRENAELDNNIDFEDDWANYMPRKYNNVSGVLRVTQSQLASIEEASGSSVFANAITTAELSGAQKARSLSEDQLPKGKAISFDFVDTFMQTAKSALYDIETQANRKYSAFALGNEKLYDVFSDKSGVDVMRNAMVQNVNNQRNVVVGGVQESAITKIMNAYQTLAVRTALGGVAQAPKQMTSAIVETTVNLGSRAPEMMTRALAALTTDTEAANALMDQFSVGVRSQESNFKNVIDIKGKEAGEFKKKLKSGMIASGINLADDVIDKMSLGLLKKGDDIGAKMSWLAYYMDYQARKEGKKGTFDTLAESQKPNMDAAAYAEHMTSLTLNINDSQLKSTGKITALLAPFASFNINAKINLISNMKRLAEMRDYNGSESRQLIKLISGNLSSMVAMNMMGLMIRSIMITGASTLVKAALQGGADDDKDKEKAIQLVESLRDEQYKNNWSNTYEYMAKDLIYGGIAGGITDPIYDEAKGVLFEWMGKEKPKTYTNDSGIASTLGLFSIPLRTSQKLYKNFKDWNQSDADFIQERYGIENAQGDKIITPDENKDETRSETTKFIYKLATVASMVQMTGLSSQEVSALMSRSASMARKIDDQMYSKKNHAKVDDLKKLETITISGKNIKLTDEEYKFRLSKRKEFLDEAYDKMLADYKDGMGRRFSRVEFEQKMKSMADRYANANLAEKYEHLSKGAVIEDQMKEEEEEEEKFNN